MVLISPVLLLHDVLNDGGTTIRLRHSPLEVDRLVVVVYNLRFAWSGGDIWWEGEMMVRCPSTGTEEKHTLVDFLSGR